MQIEANAQPALAAAGSWGLAELGHSQIISSTICNNWYYETELFGNACPPAGNG